MILAVNLWLFCNFATQMAYDELILHILKSVLFDHRNDYKKYTIMSAVTHFSFYEQQNFILKFQLNGLVLRTKLNET